MEKLLYFSVEDRKQIINLEVLIISEPQTRKKRTRINKRNCRCLADVGAVRRAFGSAECG